MTNPTHTSAIFVTSDYEWRVHTCKDDGGNYRCRVEFRETAHTILGRYFSAGEWRDATSLPDLVHKKCFEFINAVIARDGQADLFAT